MHEWSITVLSLYIDCYLPPGTAATSLGIVEKSLCQANRKREWPTYTCMPLLSCQTARITRRFYMRWSTSRACEDVNYHVGIQHLSRTLTVTATRRSNSISQQDFERLRCPQIIEMTWNWNVYLHRDAPTVARCNKLADSICTFGSQKNLWTVRQIMLAFRDFPGVGC